MQRVIDVFQARIEYYAGESSSRVLASNNAYYARLPPEMVRAAVSRVFAAVAQDLVSGTVRAFPALLGAIGGQRADHGARVSDILSGMAFGFELVTEDFGVQFAGDLEARLFWETTRSRLSYAGAMALADTFLEAREAMVRAQGEEIFRLSAPILPLYGGILLLPLVGRIDAERAGRITLALLEGIVTHAAEVALIDVTGLSNLDAAVADHLLGAARAARLVGATPAFVGVSPAMATALVGSGSELSGFETLSDLEDGLHYALGRLGKTVASARARRKR
ncbi:STAS domain-containing protein [Polyangium aurulentum]|uniref:STAS domain-containing protein n=1 Tax=Polyangium aurulentum TaxID=2567896 RepID=UPI0010AE74A8|nr:STAS domain-containing protein [Polyangium aurulentum]UQA58300.1 STAS domain-containing protein [Polyangium aurulentum]